MALYLIAGHTWWHLLALFIVYDLSAIGYLAGPFPGALLYNAVHSWFMPAVLIFVAIVMRLNGEPFVMFETIGASWAFHVALDRAFGYGLKETSSFADTHLGRLRWNR